MSSPSPKGSLLICLAWYGSKKGGGEAEGKTTLHIKVRVRPYFNCVLGGRTQCSSLILHLQ